MTKKTYIGILSIALALSVSLFTVGASSNTKLQNYSSNTESSPAAQTGKVLATVDGKKIYESDFEENLKAYRAAVSIQSGNLNATANTQAQQNGKAAESAPKSNRQLLTSLIKVQVITDDCEKAGIRVTREEAKATLEKNLETFRDLMRNGTGLEKKQARAAWNSYDAVAQKMGLTLDEYNEKQGVTATQTALIESRHYQHFVSGLSQKDLTEEQTHSLYDQYVQGLIQKSKVTVNDALLNSIK